MGESGDAVKERPILFSGSMVREILADRKTQTRRPVKPQPTSATVTWGCVGGKGFGFLFGDAFVRCPYGAPGDQLWVRETFAHDGSANHSPSACWFRADPCTRDAPGVPCEHGPERWTPGIHMPRWACRLVLEVESVRIERLHAITEEDARAEGMEIFRAMPPADASCRETLLRRWDGMYGGGEFAAAKNPWVWVVTFRRVDAARSAA
jgi:hypothetical protein